MMLAIEVTWPTQMPTGLLIIRAHYSRLSDYPTGDDLLDFRIHDSAVVLSAHSFRTGYGSAAEGLTLTRT